MSKTKPQPYVVRPGEKIRLSEIPSDHPDTPFDKKSGYKKIAENAIVMADLARRLYAENKRSVLLVPRHGYGGQRRYDPLSDEGHEP